MFLVSDNGLYAFSKYSERLVNGLSFVELGESRLGLIDTFAACQIYQMQRDLLLIRLKDGEDDYDMRTTTDLVHFRAGYSLVDLNHLEDLVQILSVFYLPLAPLFVLALTIFVQQVVDFLLIDLQTLDHYPPLFEARLLLLLVHYQAQTRSHESFLPPITFILVEHRVCLPAARLSITQYAAIVTGQ